MADLASADLARSPVGNDCIRPATGAASSPLVSEQSRRGRFIMKPFTKLAALLLGVVALAHLYRIVWPFEVVIAGSVIPQSVSVVGLIIAGALSLMLWRESRSGA
jgi:hypothetical protein